jgi:hypothetical protein
MTASILLASTDTTGLVKLCSGYCSLPRPLNEFRARSKDSEVRHSWCNECHARGERERRERRRRDEVNHLAVELGRARDRDEASRLCKVAVAGFGGVYALARKLWQTYEAAEPGSPTAARILLALLRLQELAAPKRPDVTEMSNEELDERLERLHTKLMAKAAAELAADE